MPFQPIMASKAATDNQAFFNLYLNAVHQEDRHVAAIIRRVRELPSGPRTVIVYTSDHGEAFREHGQTGHTFSVFDEEIHVPAWIDAPDGLFTSKQEASLREKAHAYTFHADLAATLIDLVGVLDDPGIDRYRERIIGKSLLRPGNDGRPMPLTNCAGVWSCAFENWGYMRRSLKLEARSWSQDWHCYDVAEDPLERHDLGIERCGELEQLAVRTFGGLPGRE